MNTFFGDTFYFKALLHPGDDWHPQVVAFTAALPSARIMTTQEVLVEVLTTFGGHGRVWRQTAAEYVAALSQNPSFIVLPQSEQSFTAGLELYRRRLDKNWSMTDCISMEMMKRHDLRQVLTHDEHFDQAGYEAIFRQERYVRYLPRARGR
jgi:uncharacterized protein